MQRHRHSSSYKVVMYIQKLHCFCNTSSPDDGQSWAESTWEINNYGKYINQFTLNTIKSIWQYERINKKICRQKMSIMFNEICINEEMLPKYTYINIYIYMHAQTHVCIHKKILWLNLLNFWVIKFDNLLSYLDLIFPHFFSFYEEAILSFKFHKFLGNTLYIVVYRHLSSFL